MDDGEGLREAARDAKAPDEVAPAEDVGATGVDVPCAADDVGDAPAAGDAEPDRELLAVREGEWLTVAVTLAVDVVLIVGLTEAPVLKDDVGESVADGVMLLVADGVGVRVTAVGSTVHEPGEPVMP